MTEGLASSFRSSSFRSLHCRTPFCEVNCGRPRPGPATFTVARRCCSFRLAAPLARIAKMPRIRFYNRRSRYEHPQKHHFWRPLSIAVGDPPATELRILRTRRFRRAFVKDAGPPRGHPASNGRAFDGAQPALVTRQPRPRFRGTVGSCRSFIGERTALPRRTSDTQRAEVTIETVPFRAHRPDSPPRVNADGFPKTESWVPSAEEARYRSSLTRTFPQGGRPPLANGSGHRTFSSRFENLD
jgi:hypothetical protein